MNKFNVLIIDDRPMVIAGIKSVLLSQKIIDKPFLFKVSNCYEKAIDSIRKMNMKGLNFNIIIADLDLKLYDRSLFDYNENKVIDLKAISENSKIIATIRSRDNYRIYKICRTLRPDGFLLETELNTPSLIDLFKSVFNEYVYYSKSVFNILKNNHKSLLLLDDIDREILYLLSKGVKTKNLPNYIPRSLSALEKRKQRIKDILVMNNCTDEELIERSAILELI